jgi:putative protease
LSAELEKLRAQPKRWQLNATETQSSQSFGKPPAPASRTQIPGFLPTLDRFVRNLPQLEAALKCGVTTVYCEFEDPKKYREAVTTCFTPRTVPIGGRKSEIGNFVAPPRIFKTGEEWILNRCVRQCRRLSGPQLRPSEIFCGRAARRFFVERANRLTADYFKNRFGLERVTASYDLNVHTARSVAVGAPPEWFEVTIHQHMPMFHMEHCVFCAFLSKGTDYANCGRPCDTHDVKLRDRVGAEHPAQGGRRLPQHRLQFAGADRRGICDADGRTRRAAFPRGISE